jgi:hypothetical protein
MSLALERGRKPKEIEMPPVAPEAPAPEPQEQVAAAQEPHYVEQPQQATQETQEPQGQDNSVRDEPVSQQPRESAQAKNFRELRDKVDRYARERDEAIQRIKDLEAAKSQSDDYNLSSDDLVEGKHLARLVKEQRQLKEQLQRYEQQQALTTAESRLRSKFPDFDQVVNADTINALKEIDPEAVSVLQSSAHNPEATMSMAYRVIKSHNLGPQAPRKVDSDTLKAQQNAAKPRPLNTVAAQHAESPISRMNAFAGEELTQEVKDQLLKEMTKARRAY